MVHVDDGRQHDPLPLPWPLPDGGSLRAELQEAYAAPTRAYHDERHLAEVLGRLGELADAGSGFDLTPVLLAAWFHDAVYDGERDAEERSAAWAEEALPSLVGPETVAEVARLVRLTELHDPADDDVNGCALSDADLGILATEDGRYEEYAAAVRTEYAHLSDHDFTRGRRSVLAALAAKPLLFHTPHGRAHWEDRARRNIERELTRLAG